MIYDQFTRERFGETSGLVVRPGLSGPYVISGQTLDELRQRAIDKRLRRKSPTEPATAASVRASSAISKESIARFNKFAETGTDLDFHRGETPIEIADFGPRRAGNDKTEHDDVSHPGTGPYYAAMTAAGTLDTKGGPKINAKGPGARHERPTDSGLCMEPAIASRRRRVRPTGQVEARWVPPSTFGGLAGKHAALEPEKEQA